MKNSQKQLLISLVTFIGGLYFFLEFLLPEEFPGVDLDPLGFGIPPFKFGAYHQQITRALQVIGVMAIGLGLINVLRVHGSRVLKGAKNWPNSFALIVGLAAMLIIEGLDLRNSESSSAFRGRFDHLALFVQRIQADGKTNPEAQLMRIDALEGALIKLERAPLADFAFEPPTAETAPELSKRISSARQKTAEFKQAFESKDENRIGQTGAQLAAQLKSAAQLAQETASAAYKTTRIKRASNLLSEGFIIPLGSTMFALLAFYIA